MQIATKRRSSLDRLRVSERAPPPPVQKFGDVQVARDNMSCKKIVGHTGLLCPKNAKRVCVAARNAERPQNVRSYYAPKTLHHF